MKYSYKTQGVCSTQIEFEINDDVISNVSFTGGCNGNLKAISKLIDNKSVDYIESILKGNTCGPRQTSCADQLSIALFNAINE
jgi:uncharacterized protein (TIGR03905 family)